MRFAQHARVVLLRSLRDAASGALIEPAGAQGVVERERGSVVIVRFIASGRTMSVKSARFGNGKALPQKGER